MDIHKTKWLHIGNMELHKGLFIKTRNQDFLNKPRGGIWVSPYTPDDEYISSWVEFLDCNNMRSQCNQGTLITFKENTRVYIIDSYEDLLKISSISKEDIFAKRFSEILDMNDYKDKLLVDFETIGNNYDLLYLTKRGEMLTRDLLYQQTNMRGWDCESAVILNFDCIASQDPFSTR